MLMTKQNCVLGFRVDAEVVGSHNLVGVRCDEYIDVLERSVIDLSGSTVFLDNLREEVGLGIVGKSEGVDAGRDGS